MFKLSPFASRANEVYNKIPWQEVIHQTFASEAVDGRHIRLHDTEAIHFGNVSYVGLDVDERLKNAAIEAIRRYGVQFSSSRSYVQLPLYEQLEDLLQQMFGRPTVVTPTTTLGHQACMPLLMLDGDAVLVDYQAHASLQTVLEIVRSKGAKVEYVLHNDVERLEQRLAELTSKHERVWYVADGIYSMYGDPGPLSALPGLMKKFDNLCLYLDDAHGMSWTGENGTGFVCDQMPLNERTVLVTSLNKGFASGGGAIVCPNEEVKTWLRRCGGTLIFSGPVQPSALAAGIESAKIHLSPEIEMRQNRVKENIRHFIEVAKQYNVVLADDSETPIFFVGVGKMEAGAKLCWQLREAGYYTNLGIFPAVPQNRTGLRISLCYHTEKEDIEQLIRLIAEMMPMVIAEENSSQEHIEKVFARRPAPAFS